MENLLIDRTEGRLFAQIHSGLQYAHEGQIAVIIIVVEAVAHHKRGGNGEAGIVRLERDLAARRLVEQRADLDGVRLALVEELHDHLERVAGVDDVLEDEHVAALNIVVDVLAEGQLAGRLGASLERGDAHEVLLYRNGDRLRHLRKEGDDALENADQNGAFAAVILRDLRADLADPGVNILFRDQNPFDVLHHVKFVHHTSRFLFLVDLY